MFGFSSCTTTKRLKLPPLETVESVELERYLGTWYEIASYPQWFQKGCTATTANYTLREDGLIEVLNQCRRGSLDAPVDEAVGLARVSNVSTNAELEVSFFRPFWGDYWIIDLDSDYQYAVVGDPGRDYLWILSRTPAMERMLFVEVLARIEAKGYEISRLQKTKHSPQGPTNE